MSACIDLVKRRCAPSDGSVSPMTTTEVDSMLTRLHGWSHRDGTITKTYRFRNHWETMAFVNAAAWISHREDHHPDLTVSYDACTVAYSTHAIGGLSENDFICAAKLDALFDL